ncbi:MAG: transaldolase [Actinomycetota bacterium]|nr:transaldolase [Actinomycetota bacterium]
MASGKNAHLNSMADFGTSPWIDNISRDWLEDGTLSRLIDDGVVGLTSNPTIFANAISKSSVYDGQIKELKAKGFDAGQIALELAKSDVAAAASLLEPVYQRTGHLDGWVSLEVDPFLAFDSEATIKAAREISQELVVEGGHKNVMVKIPATKAGLGPIEEAIASGISVNVTLIFSIARYREVYEAFLRGAERGIAAGVDYSHHRSVASFFVSRLDTAIDPRLAEHPELQGKVAIAQSKLAYQTFLEVAGGERSQRAIEAGVAPQRPLWASTSSKNPNYPDLVYVDNLIGPNTVNTMPLATMEAVIDHGAARKNSILEGVDEAREVIETKLTEAGIDLGAVTAELESQGVSSFSASWKQLLDEIEKKAL